jgi:hypothetical protein
MSKGYVPKRNILPPVANAAHRNARPGYGPSLVSAARLAAVSATPAPLFSLPVKAGEPSITSPPEAAPEIGTDFGQRLHDLCRLHFEGNYADIATVVAVPVDQIRMAIRSKNQPSEDLVSRLVSTGFCREFLLNGVGEAFSTSSGVSTLEDPSGAASPEPGVQDSAAYRRDDIAAIENQLAALERRVQELEAGPARSTSSATKPKLTEQDKARLASQAEASLDGSVWITSRPWYDARVLQLPVNPAILKLTPQVLGRRLTLSYRSRADSAALDDVPMTGGNKLYRVSDLRWTLAWFLKYPGDSHELRTKFRVEWRAFAQDSLDEIFRDPARLHAELAASRLVVFAAMKHVPCRVVHKRRR